MNILLFLLSTLPITSSFLTQTHTFRKNTFLNGSLLDKAKSFYKEADELASQNALLLNKDLEDRGMLEKITDETGLKVVGRDPSGELPPPSSTSNDASFSENVETAKGLFQKYGIAYLATSIPLSLLSFTLCYSLVSSGVDVASLLSKINIVATSNTENLGTAGIAYIAHKALSPVRFPPTLLLTPIVANLLGSQVKVDNDDDDDDDDE